MIPKQSSAETAFSAFPTSERGVLLARDYTPLSLHGCDASVEVKGHSVRVLLRYEYVNETATAQAVIAAYPQPLLWNLQHCQLSFDGEEVQTVYEKTAVYSSSEAASALAAAGSVSDRTVWTVACQSVPWVIPVGGAVLMAATYHLALDRAVQDGEFRLELPAALFPTVRRPPEVARDYNTYFCAGHARRLKSGIALRVLAELFVPLRGEVGLYATDFYRRKRQQLDSATVSYAGDTGFAVDYHTPPLEKAFRPAFVVACRVEPTAEPLRLFVEREVPTEVTADVVPADCRYAVGVAFTPAIADCAPNAEIVFIMDTHGAVAALAAAHALYTALLGLPPSVFVNVVALRAGTGQDDVCLMRDGSRRAAELGRGYVEQVCTYLAELPPQRVGAGRGRLTEALRSVLAATGPLGCGRPPAGFVRHAVVVSDAGEAAADAGELLAVAAAHRHTARVSCVAVDCAGAGADVALLERLAAEGGGVCEVAGLAEEVPAALATAVAAAAVPVLTDIRAEFPEGAEVRPAFLPDRIAVIPAGAQRRLYGLSPETDTVTFYATGRVGERSFEYTASTGVGAAEQPLETHQQRERPRSAGLLHLTAAAARIRHLIEENRRTAPLRCEVDEALLLSRVFSLPSPYTGMVQYRRVDDDGYDSVRAPERGVPLAHRYATRAATYESEVRARRAELRALQAQQLVARAPAPQAAPQLPFVAPSTTNFILSILADILDSILTAPNADRLVPLQREDGSFVASDVLCTALAVTPATVAECCPEDAGDATEGVWPTVIAVAAFRGLASRVAVLAERKAVAYLNAQRPGWEKWLESANRMLNIPSDGQ